MPVADADALMRYVDKRLEQEAAPSGGADVERRVW